MKNNIEIRNIVPKFLEFYHLANAENSDSEERWKLWQKHYNFAAVPPGEGGEKIARALLDDAWEKYAEHINCFENWQPNETGIEEHLENVKEVLGFDRAINFVVVYFVGGFENNPFVAPIDEDTLALCLPIETEISDIFLTHELTHIVHAKTADLSSEWERSIGTVILQEGLATQVSKQLVPGKQAEDYLAEDNQGWFQGCKSMRKEILEGILPYLEDSSSETLTKFMFGEGTTGNDREVYFVGWEIVKSLLEQGVSLKEIAHIKENEVAQYLHELYPSLL